jgi:hypothetical protein
MDLTSLESEYMETSEKNVNGIDEKEIKQGRTKLDKKHYTAPSLKSLGRLNSMTLGASLGLGDSGNELYAGPEQ